MRHLLLTLLACTLSAYTTSAQTIETLVQGDSVKNPYGIVIGPDRSLYYGSIDNHAVYRVDLKTRNISTVLDKDIDQPYELRFDKAGNLFFVDMTNHVVRRFDKKTRAVTTIAGTGQAGFSGDGGDGSKAQLKQPHSIALDRSGGLLICDIGNHRVRRVDLKTGSIETFLGEKEKLNGPRAIDFDAAGNLYLALREGNAVYRVNSDKSLQRIAGNGQKGFTGETLNGPKGVAVAPDGSVYIADTENHAIRKFDPKTGTLTTVAGTGERGDGPDGDPLKCRMNRPHGVFVDSNGLVYIADSENHRIRVLHTAKSR